MMGNGVKRSKEDDLFSKLVRERANWQCEYCGRDFSANRTSLHCSHFQGRRSAATRWHPMNASAHCVGCHRILGEQPGEHTKWMEAKIGEDMVWRVIRASKTPKKLSKVDKAELYKHLKQELCRIKELRETGDCAWAEFTVPDFYSV